MKWFATGVRWWQLVLVLLLGSGTTLFACVWVFGTTKDGKQTLVSGFGPAKRLRHFLREDMKAIGSAMEDKYRDSTGFTNRNDYAVALMYLGKSAEAIQLLEKLENEKPGEYYTAANLGTACELAGRNKEALKWIKEGIRRNSNSHDGTEWLHVKILEAKIQAAREPDYFKHHSVLDLDYSQIERDVKSLSVGGESREVGEVLGALEFQLRERLQFVRTKDAPVAGLLFDYAAIEAATHSLESAKQLLQLAMEFGYPNDRVEPLLARYDNVIRLASIRQYLIYISVVLLVVSFLIHAWRKRWIVWKRTT